MMRWFSDKTASAEMAVIPVYEVVRVLREYADGYPTHQGASALREMAAVFAAADDPVGDEWAEYPPPE